MKTLLRTHRLFMSLGLFAFAPLISRAAGSSTAFVCSPGIRGLLCDATELVELATGILAALALLVFFWGLVKYIAKADDEKAKESGKNIMIWGVIALFVMFSIFGIVKFLQNSFGITAGNNRSPGVPTVIFPIP